MGEETPWGFSFSTPRSTTKSSTSTGMRDKRVLETPRTRPAAERVRETAIAGMMLQNQSLPAHSRQCPKLQLRWRVKADPSCSQGGVPKMGTCGV